MAADTEIDDEAPVKKGIPKLFIIIGAVAVVVLLAGAGTFYMLSSGTAEAEHGAEATGAEGGVIEVANTFIFNLPPMVINLNNEADGEAFMKLTVALEVTNEAMMLEIQPRMTSTSS